MLDHQLMPSKETTSNFIRYFSEFRRMLIHTVILFFVTFLCLAPFSKYIYAFLARPLQSKLPVNAHMIATDITSTFVAPFKLVFFVSVALLIPFIFFKIYSFLKSALYLNEKKVFFIFFPISILLFYTGVSLGYFFILPKVLGFFIGIAPETVIPMTDINQYLMFCIKFFLVLGFVFQLPLITVILIYFNVVERETLKSKRPYIFVICFFIAMFITPPDILSMAIAGCFMYLLFELGLIFASLMMMLNKRNPS